MPDEKSSRSHYKTANDVTSWKEADATDRIEEMFVELIQRRRIERGQTPALRTVFLKQHGVAHGTFEPLDSLRESLKVGLFSHCGEFPCWVRFSSDTQPTSADLHSTLGIGIKLFGVPGATEMGEGDTADFIMQNHDVFFVDDAHAFFEFTTAGVVDGDYPGYLKRHPETAQILNEMMKAEASCLTANYWGLLPFRFGDDRAVKYMLEPTDATAGEPFDDSNYLGIDLARRLREGPAKFRFKVQFQIDEERMPLDKSTVRWDSPWEDIADLVLPQQDIVSRGQAEFGENLAFNIWRTPPEHAPLGSIAAVRRKVYQGSADQRRLANGVSLAEPANRVAASEEEHAPGPDTCIVKAAIYPPIGVCRVGNSTEAGEDGFYIGPEVPEPTALERGAYRDSHGRLKREAARFRIYGLNALGQAVKELVAAKPDDKDKGRDKDREKDRDKDDDLEIAEIRWAVTLANQKSSWYEFQLALDIPEAADAPPSLLRNSTVSDRSTLSIEPGERKIKGTGESGKKYRFDSGTFLGTKVYLGELRTDDKGRLIVLGGHGVSASHDGTRAVTFANNEGWHDDVSDGPVKAEVTYQGVRLKVEPAWVITAPPNYGPQQKSVRTMWDLMRDIAVTNGMLARPERPSFQHDIRPLFERLHDLQWVNQGFAAAFGFGGQWNLATPEWLARLNDPSPAHVEMRRTIQNAFRHFDVDSWSPAPWPWVYGDAMAVPAAHTPRQHATLSDLQLGFLDQWVLGNFDADYKPDAEPPRKIDDVPVALQPDMLTKAAMEFCLADAFHPGCEMTWPMRQPGMYMSAYRLSHRKASNSEPSYGAQLTSDVWTLPDGPINGGQSPGSISRWMAVPWQTDTASCRSGYDKTYDPYLPTFWPGRVPNEVMSEEAYKIVMNTELGLSERLQAFANRANWLEPLGLDKSYTHQINHMIHHFGEMGVVESRLGLPDDAHFPDTMQVSDQREETWKESNVEDRETRVARLMTVQHEGSDDGADAPDAPADLTQIDKVRRFPNGLRARTF